MSNTETLRALVDAVEAARSKLGAMRPDSRLYPEDAVQWDALTRVAALLSAAPAAPVVGFPWENFPSFLIDKCEGDTITEERLQRAAADMLNDPKYMKAAAPAVQVDEDG